MPVQPLARGTKKLPLALIAGALAAVFVVLVAGVSVKYVISVQSGSKRKRKRDSDYYETPLLAPIEVTFDPVNWDDERALQQITDTFAGVGPSNVWRHRKHSAT